MGAASKASPIMIKKTLSKKGLQLKYINIPLM